MSVHGLSPYSAMVSRPHVAVPRRKNKREMLVWVTGQLSGAKLSKLARRGFNEDSA
jgi:hypothetical protein